MTAAPRRILLVSDAWQPQVNGVITTLKRTSECLREAGHRVEVLGPSRFCTVSRKSSLSLRCPDWLVTPASAQP